MNGRFFKKRAIVVLLICICMNIFIFNVSTFAHAGLTNIVYAETVHSSACNQISIPVKIKNNSGFMGFSFIVKYNNRQIKPISVTSGSLLTEGMFNDSINVNSQNHYKIVYTNTRNIKNDGELFILQFDIKENVNDDIYIEITYEPQDSFNENWEDVHFNCEKITIKIEHPEDEVPTANIVYRILEFFRKIIEMLKQLIPVQSAQL